MFPRGLGGKARWEWEEESHGSYFDSPHGREGVAAGPWWNLPSETTPPPLGVIHLCQSLQF